MPLKAVSTKLVRRSINISELQGCSKKELISLIVQQNDIQIPVSVFSTSISPLTALVKYLHDEIHLPVNVIADRLHRHVQTIWTTYRLSKGLELKPMQTHLYVPLSQFSKDKFSILESMIPYLMRTYGLTISQIALMLNRSQKTIWTSYDRFRKKGGKT